MLPSGEPLTPSGNGQFQSPLFVLETTLPADTRGPLTVTLAQSARLSRCLWGQGEGWGTEGHLRGWPWGTWTPSSLPRPSPFGISAGERWVLWGGWRRGFITSDTSALPAPTLLCPPDTRSPTQKAREKPYVCGYLGVSRGVPGDVWGSTLSGEMTVNLPVLASFP